jgi:ribonuclease HI
MSKPRKQAAKNAAISMAVPSEVMVFCDAAHCLKDVMSNCPEGHSGVGYVVQTLEGDLIFEEALAVSKRVNGSTDLEFYAICCGARAAMELGASRIRLYSDCASAVEHFGKVVERKDRSDWPRYLRKAMTSESITYMEAQKCSRQTLSRAHSLAREAMRKWRPAHKRCWGRRL